MLSTISTASLSVPLTFPTCVKPNQHLMNMLGAVWMELVPVGAGLQVPGTLLKRCSRKRQIFTSELIKSRSASAKFVYGPFPATSRQDSGYHVVKLILTLLFTATWAKACILNFL